MTGIILQPTVDNSYRIIYDNPKQDLGEALQLSQYQESQGEIEKACNTRFESFQILMELLPDEEITLEWEDNNNQNAMLLVNYSAIDHFLVGDFEMCAAMLELILELDPEDHLEATKRLAYTYVALEEYELFDEIINDISDKYADKEILNMWCEFRREGTIPEGEFIRFKKSFKAYYEEFKADEHPVSQDYICDIENDHPKRETLARELWLQTEHLWAMFPDFITELKKH